MENSRCPRCGYKVELLNLDVLDQQAILIAYHVVELLERRHKDPPKSWISQNKAWKEYGGRAFVERLREDRKVATRRNKNRREYYVPDLAKHVKPQAIIIQNRKYIKKETK